MGTQTATQLEAAARGAATLHRGEMSEDCFFDELVASGLLTNPEFSTVVDAAARRSGRSAGA